MHDLLLTSTYFGVLISLISYGIGCWLKKKTGLGIFNPLLVACILTIAAVLGLKMEYSVYYEGAKYLSYLLTPATICLALPLYEKFELLKKNWFALLVGMVTGVLTSVCSVLLLSILFRFDHKEYVTFLPKSITTAIGMGVSEEMGGYVAITVAVIMLTGVLGNILAETVCRVFRITDPIARGIGIGSASHAIGTTKAMEMGETEGAMSSLSIVVSGLLTVVAAMIFAPLL
ncbi:MAG: LrgB family protein [Eubacteriales bacterium]|nr:LrgB family protein [Eubacteriales bacterium]